jgi:hypothetical protein
MLFQLFSVFHLPLSSVSMKIYMNLSTSTNIRKKWYPIKIIKLIGISNKLVINPCVSFRFSVLISDTATYEFTNELL